MEIIQNYEPKRVPMQVSHADVTPANLIIEKRTGRLKLVDNELLNQSWYYLIDLFNTYASLGNSRDLAKSCLQSYQETGGNFVMLLEHRRFFLALWGLRIIGSALQAGDISRAFRLADTLRSDDFRSHPLVWAAEKIRL